jgi:hypothetical protein
LIYNDPTRHFGGALDDTSNRLQHYLNVLCREIRRLGENPLQTGDLSRVSSLDKAESFCFACE